jgi:hypothetical protein
MGLTETYICPRQVGKTDRAINILNSSDNAIMIVPRNPMKEQLRYRLNSGKIDWVYTIGSPELHSIDNGIIETADVVILDEFMFFNAPLLYKILDRLRESTSLFSFSTSNKLYNLTPFLFATSFKELGDDYVLSNQRSPRDIIEYSFFVKTRRIWENGVSTFGVSKMTPQLRNTFEPELLSLEIEGKMFENDLGNHNNSSLFV